jgi:hypothetical protein
MRGLSGAVTALILVVASVVIALIVVGFAFNLFGNFASQGTNTVTPVGSANIYTKSEPPGITFPSGYTAPSNAVYLVVTINNKGPNVSITSAIIGNQTVIPYQVLLVYSNTTAPTGTSAKPLSGLYIPTGQNTLVIVFTGVKLLTGSSVNVDLNLQNNQVIYLTAYVAT